MSSCPALGHLGNPQVGGWCAVIKTWWIEAREGLEAIAGPSGCNCSSDYEGDMSPLVGRQAKTVTKATWAKRQLSTQKMDNCGKQVGDGRETGSQTLGFCGPGI